MDITGFLRFIDYATRERRFWDHIDYYGTQNALILREYGIREDSRIGARHVEVLERPLIQLMMEFKSIVFNPHQDIRRHNWPVGFHFVVFMNNIADQPIEQKIVHFSGSRICGPWTVLAGKIRGSRRRVKVVMPRSGTHMFIIVHEA
jgi:hypothetical protein